MVQVVLDIGESAGIIWRFLSDRGPATFAQLKRGTRLDEAVLHQGIGWLAREDKLALEATGRTHKVALK